MVVIYERDARNPSTVHPYETECPVCNNRILYRLGDREAAQGWTHRECPVCHQETELSIPGELQEAARKHFEDSVPPEIRDAAEKWFNKRQTERDRIRQKRQKQE